MKYGCVCLLNTRVCVYAEYDISVRCIQRVCALNTTYLCMCVCVCVCVCVYAEFDISVRCIQRVCVLNIMYAIACLCA